MKAHASIPLRIITHNIRYATDSPFKGEKPWSDRKHLIINELHYTALHNPEAFICLQEVLHEQLLDILSGLNSTTSSLSGQDEWAYIGVGRDDGKQNGEYSPIIYRAAIWSVSKWNTVWLSPTPEKPGKGWDAGSVRIVTVGTFVHGLSKTSVVGLCTHFDNDGQLSRRESARLIERVVDDAISVPGTKAKLPVFLAGDLNSEPDGEAYRILNGRDSRLVDAKGLSAWRYGDEETYTGFGEDELSVIDYVFLGAKSKDGVDAWEVQGFSVLPNVFDAGVYSSDHRAVVVDTILNI